MPTRVRSSGYSSASACRASTWSSSVAPAKSSWIAFSQAGEVCGVPRPSATITAKPWSANHCDVRWASPARWPDGSSTAAGIPRAPTRARRARAASTGSSAYEATVATCLPSRSTRTTEPGRSRAVDASTVTAPDRTATCRPGVSERRSTPPSPTRYTCASPVSGSAASGPADAAKSTSSPSTSSTDSTCRSGPVSARSPAIRTRAPPPSPPPSPVSEIRSSRPPGSQVGTPSKSSSHFGSSSACSTRVAPVAVSTARYAWSRWSRDWTSSTGGPSADQWTRAR